MMSLSRPSSRDVIILSAIALGTIVLYWLVLWAIAEPPHFKDRLAVVEANFAQVDAARRAPGDGTAYPANATCQGEPVAMESALRQQIAAAAAASAVDLTIAETGSPAEPERNQKLTAFTVGFDASGPYANVMAFANKLGQMRPALFADTVGLDQGDATVTFKFSGRVLCSAAL